MYHVAYNNNDRGKVFTVHTMKGPFEFLLHPKGLLYLDLEQHNRPDAMFTMKIRNNYERRTKHEVRKAIGTRRLQGMVGHPSQWDIERLVCNSMITHCPITSQDVSIAYEIASTEGSHQPHPPTSCPTSHH